MEKARKRKSLLIITFYIKKKNWGNFFLEVLSSFPTNGFLNGETNNAKCQLVSNPDSNSSPEGLPDQDDKVGICPS